MVPEGLEVKNGWYKCWIGESCIVRFIIYPNAYYFDYREIHPNNRVGTTLEIIETTCLGPITQYKKMEFILEAEEHDFSL